MLSNQQSVPEPERGTQDEPQDRGDFYLPGMCVDGVGLVPSWMPPTRDAAAPPLPAAEAPAASLEDRLERAIEGLCPCGAAPSDEFSPYCGYACKPTHYSGDSMPGTAARWRPDLVDEDLDDDDLSDLNSSLLYQGRYTARIFQRGDEVDGAVTWHLRLNDGERFVGIDLPDVREIDEQMQRRLIRGWRALERELENPDSAMPEPESPRLEELVQGLRENFPQLASLPQSRWEEIRAELESDSGPLAEALRAAAVTYGSDFQVVRIDICPLCLIDGHGPEEETEESAIRPGSEEEEQEGRFDAMLASLLQTLFGRQVRQDRSARSLEDQ